MEPWRTGITTSDESHIWIHGYEVTAMMGERSFADVVFLLHKGRLPSAAERRVIDAILVAVADYGPSSPSCAAARLAASGNRQAPEAAIAAGVLAIGDAHGGAGLACMELMAAGIERSRRERLSFDAAALAIVKETVSAGGRIPGLGHRKHSVDPRTQKLLALVRDAGLAGDGLAFAAALETAVAAVVKPMPLNVDGAIAAVLHDLGFAPPMGKLMFIIGRVAGLTAHVMEEYTRERPMRIKIPVAYDGPAPRAVPAPEAVR
jgi:citrate synthase